MKVKQIVREGGRIKHIHTPSSPKKKKRGVKDVNKKSTNSRKNRG